MKGKGRKRKSSIEAMPVPRGAKVWDPHIKPGAPAVTLTAPATEDRSSQDMVLSLVVPGLGQLAQGRRVVAATQFVTVIGYLAASIAGAGGRAWWLAFAWSAWSAVDAYRHGKN